MKSLILHGVTSTILGEISNSTTATHGYRKITVQSEGEEFEINLFGEKEGLKILINEQKQI